MKLIITIVTFFYIVFLYGQQSSSVEGILINSNDYVTLANVTLLKKNDSTFVANTISDNNGGFKLTGLKAGQFILEISHLSYTSKYLEINLVDGKTHLNLGIINIDVQNNELMEVTINSKIPAIIKTSDRFIINVKNSAAIATNTNANELIKNLPGIWIDRNNNILLKGQENVQIMVNGRSNYLNGSNLSNFLKSLPSGFIDKVELIFNPDASFDAESSAIINIVTSKSVSFGFKGSINLGGGESIGYDTYNPKMNSGINLSYGFSNFSIFTNYGYSYDDSFRRITENLAFTDSELNQSIFLHNNPEQSHNIQSGINLDLNSKNSINLFYNKTYTDTHVEQTNAINIISQNDPIESILSNSNESLISNQDSFNMEFKSQFDSIKKLKLSTDFLILRKNHKSNYTNVINSDSNSGTEKLRNDSNTNIKVWVSQGDYTNQTGKTGTLDMGVKYSYVKTINNVLFEMLENNQWVLNDSISNKFNFTENTFASYINFKKRLKKIDIIVGLRYENSNISGKSVVNQFSYDKTISGLFPNVSFNFSFNNKIDFSLFYSKKIKRPGYIEINPFIYYLNPFTVEQGNPSLIPSITHKIQWNATLSQMYSMSLTYFKTNDYFSLAQFQDIVSKEQRLVPTNIGSLSSIELNIGLPIQLKKWWSSYTDISLFYQEFKEDPKIDLGFGINSKIYLQLFSQHEFALPKDISLEITSTILTPFVHSQFKFSSIYTFNTGIKKSFFNKKLDLKIGYNDFFRSLKNKASLGGEGWESNFQDISDSSRLNFAITYNFYSKGDVKTKKANWISDEEKSRMK